MNKYLFRANILLLAIVKMEREGKAETAKADVAREALYDACTHLSAEEQHVFAKLSFLLR